MTTSPYKSVGNKFSTPSTEPILGREKEMETNYGGKSVFTLDPFKRLDRFLILGTDKPTYYSDQTTLTKENAKALFECLNIDPIKTVAAITNVVSNRRSYRNNSALFAIALIASSNNIIAKTELKKFFLSNVKTGTDILTFVSYVSDKRGWGRYLRSLINRWYMETPVDTLNYQLAKYQNRESWTHRDVLRCTHPDTKKSLDGNKRNILIKYATHKDTFTEKEWETAEEYGFKHIVGMEKAKTLKNPIDVIKHIQTYELTREMIPTEFLNDPKVQMALLQHMPIIAMLRNLGNFSKSGLLTTFSEAEKLICSKLENEEEIKRSKIHPYRILLALKTYSSGKGFLGSGSWNVANGIVSSLEKAFYTAFQNVEPTGKNIYFAIDVSPSMRSPFDRSGVISSSEAAAALLMTSLRVERSAIIKAFAGGYGSSEITDMSGKITKNSSIAEALATFEAQRWSSTDITLPIRDAFKSINEKIDAFVIFTDNETNCNTTHVSEELKRYRNKFNSDTKLIVVATSTTGRTVADPNDSGSLDVVGFDADAPSVISDFIAGRI